MRITKKVREMLIASFALVLIVILTYVETHFGKFASTSAGNIIIFALINLNIVLIILVVFLVTRNVVKLMLERKRGMLGAKLRSKLVMAFVSLSIIPTMFLFILSVVLIYRSMEGWLSKEVENAIDESMNVAGIYYKEASSDALHYAGWISKEITDGKLLKEGNLEILQSMLKEKMDLFRLSAVEVFSAQGEELVKIKSENMSAVAELPTPESGNVKAALLGKSVPIVLRTGTADVIQGIVPIRSSFNPNDIVGVLAVNYYIPESITERLNIIKTTFSEYIETLEFKGPIRTGYIITLAMVTLIAIFSAIWFGINISKGITNPIEKLVDGTQRISMGDLGFTLDVQAKDELGILVRNFNSMVGELRDYRKNLESAYNELAYRSRYIQTVVNNISTGVVSISSNDAISMINPSAQKMLAIKIDKVIGRPYRDVLKEEHMPIVNEPMEGLENSRGTATHREITLTIDGKRLVLMVYASMMHDDNGEYMGMVVVFDDLTELQRMQRVAAWREVARRIAHEVKNPLTPIQLSAQRLRRRYMDKMTGDAEVFDECTKVIINQVDEMRKLVDEFSAFAKMPSSKPVPGNINEVVLDAVSLYRQAHTQIEYEVDADETIPQVMVDRSQMARAIGNLLENATMAISDIDAEEKKITIKTGYDTLYQIARIDIMDTGPGIPSYVKERMFEPYFSTKKGGTGLGLVIVKSVITDHGGFIRVKNNEPKGTIISIELPVKG